MTNTPHNPSKSLREPQATYTLLLPVCLPCSRFSVSQNFCSSEKYLSNMNTLDIPTTEGFILVLLAPDIGYIPDTYIPLFFQVLSLIFSGSFWLFLSSWTSALAAAAARPC